MSQNAEVKSKITNPLRVIRIISRMCEGKMQALIRVQQDAKLGIRCTFFTVQKRGHSALVHFNGISEFGVKKLAVGDTARFEVIGMPTKVVFAAKITEVGQDNIACRLPTSLISIERRQNARQVTTDSKMAYFKPSLWTPVPQDISAPPAFEQFHYLASWIPVLDISAGGLCVKTHFPSVLQGLDGVGMDEAAQLILPMASPINMTVAIRWQRRIKNRHIDADRERYQLDFRLGIEFLDIPVEGGLKIKQFLRQLSLADAV